MKISAPWTCPTPPLSLTKFCVLSHSVVSASLGPHGLWPARLVCLWNSPGKSTGVGGHAVLQGILPGQGLSLCLLYVLHCREVL